jgi:nucleoid-associated protein YgaU
MFGKTELVQLVKVKPDSGKNTRLQKFETKLNGLPKIKPTKKPNKVVRSKDTLLRVSGTHKLSESDVGDGVVKGSDGRSFYQVTDDPYNGDAAKLYVKVSDVEIYRTGEVYTVKPKDSLTKISKEFYGDKINLADDIYKANKDVIGKNPDLIHPGQTLFLHYNTH